MMRAIPTAAWLACAILVAAARPGIGQAGPAETAHGTTPASRHCAVAEDSAGARSARPVSPEGGMAMAFYSLAFAPAAITAIHGVGCEDTGRVVFWRDHVAAYVDGGASLAGTHGAFARSAEVEAFVRGVYLDARGAEYQYADRTRTWEARIGYLVNPVPPLAGGVTVGYRGADDQPDGWATRGLEVGFPLIIKGCGTRRPCTIHLNQTYVSDGRHFRLSPRYRFEYRFARPFIARLGMDFVGVRNRSPLVTTLGFGISP
jgi:hypothetical protein